LTIGLCVAVEKIAGLVSYGEPSAEKEQREKIQRLVGKWLGKRGWSDTKVGKRAIGLLGSMKNARVKDRLEGLVKSGHVDQKHIDIWEN
jgi:hypothetical protein